LENNSLSVIDSEPYVINTAGPVPGSRINTLFLLAALLFITCSTVTSIKMANQKDGLEVLFSFSGLFILYFKDILLALLSLAASYHFFPAYFTAKPDREVKHFERLMFNLCLLFTLLYLFNVYFLGQRSIETGFFYSQLNYLVPLLLTGLVMIQQSCLSVFFLSLSRSRFGDRAGSRLTVAVYGLLHLPFIFFFNWYIALPLVLLSFFSMAAWAKLAVEYNSKLAPVFLHYFFHILLFYSFSLKIFLS
jgi:hypothetical protein